MLKKSEPENQPKLFEVDLKLENVLNEKHPLYVLANEIDWSSFEEKFSPLYSENGRPACPIRLMVGLHYIKFTKDLSDEEVVWGWTENAYWQFFTGEEYFQKEFPIDPTSMTRFRNRLEEGGVLEILRETIAAGLRLKCIRPESLEKVAVDTTVQEKNIAFPTDIGLYSKMIQKLVKQGKKEGISFRQTYQKECKRGLKKHSGYMHARQLRRARKLREKIRTRLGRVIREVERKSISTSTEMGELLVLAQRLHDQQKDDKNKIYSLHEQHVECIAKGKAHKRYEFGCKVSVATTLKEGFILSCDALHGNPFDGHTLRETLGSIESNTGVMPSLTVADKGYRGHKCSELSEVIVRGVTKVPGRYKKKLVRRQSLIEAMIGHLKSDSRMDRNRLKGKLGDKVNAILCAAGQNLKKLMVFLWKGFLRLLLSLLESNFRREISTHLRLSRA